MPIVIKFEIINIDLWLLNISYHSSCTHGFSKHASYSLNSYSNIQWEMCCQYHLFWGQISEIVLDFLKWLTNYKMFLINIVAPLFLFGREILSFLSDLFRMTSSLSLILDHRLYRLSPILIVFTHHQSRHPQHTCSYPEGIKDFTNSKHFFLN